MGRKDPHTLYVLKLEPGEDPHAKWYVGITTDFQRRLYQHKCDGGVEWTSRNEIVDDYVIGRAKDRSKAEDYEKNLTKALAREYGWVTTRGAFGGRKFSNLPDVEDTLLYPGIAERLREIDDPGLSEVAKYSAVRLEVPGEILFSDAGEAADWANRYLPDETKYRIKYPGDRPGSLHVSNSTNLKAGDQPRLTKEASPK